MSRPESPGGCLWRWSLLGAALCLSFLSVFLSSPVLAGPAPSSSPSFLRGDANGNGTVDISDGVFVLIAPRPTFRDTTFTGAPSRGGLIPGSMQPSFR